MRSQARATPTKTFAGVRVPRLQSTALSKMAVILRGNIHRVITTLSSNCSSGSSRQSAVTVGVGMCATGLGSNPLSNGQQGVKHGCSAGKQDMISSVECRVGPGSFIGDDNSTKALP